MTHHASPGEHHLTMPPHHLTMPPQASIIAYIDADDQMSSRRLEVMVHLMRQHRAQLGLHSYTEVCV